jgi:hypothetical protein
MPSLIVAGGVADFAKPIHVLLKEAVQTTWPSITVDPPVTDIYFSNTWFSDSRDIEMVFLHSVEVRDITRRSVDWRFMPMVTFVDIHLFVRGTSVDSEPEILHKVRNNLDLLIEGNKTTLIPHCEITLENSVYIEEKDELQHVWHILYSCRVGYSKILVGP